MSEQWVYIVQVKARGAVIGVFASRYEAEIVSQHYVGAVITPWCVESHPHEHYKASD